MQIPQNQNLWHMLIAQARAKFAKYPSPAASHWVHEHYLKSGGKFLERTAADRQKEQMAARLRGEHKKKKKGGKDTK